MVLTVGEQGIAADVRSREFDALGDQHLWCELPGFGGRIQYDYKLPVMQTARTDRILQVSIGVLLAAFVYVIFISLYEHIVVVGDTAPDFSITADNGQTVTPTNFGGKLLVLNFWATWCPTCIEELPSLDQFQK